MELRRLLEDDAQTVTGGISRRWIATLAPRASEKLWRVHGALRSDKAGLSAVTGAQSVPVVNVGYAQG